MIVEEFTIPLDKEELLISRSGQYTVDEIIPIQLISKALSNMILTQTENGTNFIVDHFDTLFSIIVHGAKVDTKVTIKAFTKTLKGLQRLVENLETKCNESANFDLDHESKLCLLTANKMFAYLLSSLMCLIEDQIWKNANNADNIGKRKRTKSDMEEEWESYRDQMLDITYRWIQLPLKNLWQPPIVEDSFVALIGQLCYKILERSREFKSKFMKDVIFQILGLLVKKYNHGIACVVRIVQLVRLYEPLSVHIASGVVLMITECGCSGLMKEITREIDHNETSESDARNICTFFETIASTKADLIIPILDNIIEYLYHECYILRNCTVGVLGSVIIEILTGEDLDAEKKEMRDECLNNLETHMLDSNAYVRSKVLQVWQKIVCAGAIPLARQGKLLSRTSLRLNDKSANVRRHALQLLRAILQINPFASKMNKNQFSEKLSHAKSRLDELQMQFSLEIAQTENDRIELWNNQLPCIEQAIDIIIQQKCEGQSVASKKDFDVDTYVGKLLLTDKLSEAIKVLWEFICLSSTESDCDREKLVTYLHKIFINCKNNSEDNDSTLKEKIIVQEKLIDYLESCLQFSIDLENVIPVVEKLLYSTFAGDAIEACTFLGAAFEFQVPGSASSIRKAIYQVFSRDNSVRDNIIDVYKTIYLAKNADQQSTRQKALSSVKSLVNLLNDLEPGQSPAMCQLVSAWKSSGDLNTDAIQVMWEMFSMKLQNTTPKESRAALILITMFCQAEPSIIASNRDVLLKVGLGTRAFDDLLLSRDTCRAFLTLKHDVSQESVKVPRLSNDNDLFKQISSILIEAFFNESVNGYESFATEAINLIYHFADSPNEILKHVTNTILTRCALVRTPTNSVGQISTTLLARLLFIIGHSGIQELVYLDHFVYKELKRRNAVRDKKNSEKVKNVKGRQSTMNVTSSSVSASAGRFVRNSKENGEDDGEEALEGASADDADAEFISMTLENEILDENSFFGAFVAQVLDICRQADKYHDHEVQTYATLALSKFMTISSSFCEKHLQLLVTILERSPHAFIRSNILIGLSDLMTRFPNQVEPWTPHIYKRLRDENLRVRGTCVRILSNLIMGEMIRVKGQVSQLALCIVDNDTQIREDAKQLFKDLSQKGNALYNVMPDILSCLSDTELDLNEKDFQQILKYILGLLQKEKQVEGIIEKLCSRFKLATTERQWRDLSYCLSLLKFSSKSIRNLIKDLPLLKDKIHNEQVLKALYSVIDVAKKKPEAKVACLELEDKIKEMLENSESEATEMSQPSKSTKNKDDPPENRKNTRSSAPEYTEPVLDESIQIRRKKNSDRSKSKDMTPIVKRKSLRSHSAVKR